MAARKFNRAVNFSIQEEHRLIDIVEIHKAIIECKKTDSTTWREKDEEWKLIAAEFCAGTLVNRSVKELRSKYDCLKKAAKKESARQEQSLRGTGGGPGYKPARNIAVLERVLALVPLGAVGMESIVDSDVRRSARAASPESQESSVDEGGLESDVVEENIMLELDVPVTYGQPGCSGMIVAEAHQARNAPNAPGKGGEARSRWSIDSYSDLESEPEARGCKGTATTTVGCSDPVVKTTVWDIYSPAMLQRPKHPALVVSSQPSADGTPKTTIEKLKASASALLAKKAANRSRRRPVVQKKETVFSTNTAKYTKLTAAKTELAKLQMELLAREHEENRERMNKQSDLDVQLKEAELKAHAVKLEILKAKLVILKKNIELQNAKE